MRVTEVCWIWTVPDESIGLQKSIAPPPLTITYPHKPFARKYMGVDPNNARRYYSIMIRSFKCRDTQTLFYGTRVKRFANIESAAMRKLALLNRARVLEDLRIPPANRLEALAGDRKGQHSIRVNDQWRVCFKFNAGHADNVEIVDYH